MSALYRYFSAFIIRSVELCLVLSLFCFFFLRRGLCVFFIVVVCVFLFSFLSFRLSVSVFFFFLNAPLRGGGRAASLPFLNCVRSEGGRVGKGGRL